MIATKGWLKPKLLKEITGIPAADIIAKEMKEKLMEQKRSEFMKRYQKKLANLGGLGIDQQLLEKME